MSRENEVLDWDDMSDSDRVRAQELLNELNEIFNKYSVQEETETCENSISEE